MANTLGSHDDVLGREAGLLGEQPVGAREQHLEPALDGVGLAALVEGHDDDGRAVAAGQPGPGARNWPHPP